LAAARTIDTRPIRARLARFERAHRAYTQAQERVDAAEAQLHSGQARLAERDVERDQAIEVLARALVSEGQPRVNPFAAFGAFAPKKLGHLPAADQVKAVHALVAAVQRQNGLGKPTLQAAQVLDKAASAVEQAWAALVKLQASVRDARSMRDAVLQTWTKTLATLKRDARSATDEGAPLLYATLFDHGSRPNGKRIKPAPAPAPAVDPAAPAQPPVAA
jgi:multidrug resistance efflux pump